MRDDVITRRIQLEYNPGVGRLAKTSEAQARAVCSEISSLSVIALRDSFCIHAIQSQHNRNND